MTLERTADGGTAYSVAGPVAVALLASPVDWVVGAVEFLFGFLYKAALALVTSLMVLATVLAIAAVVLGVIVLVSRLLDSARSSGTEDELSAR